MPSRSDDRPRPPDAPYYEGGCAFPAPSQEAGGFAQPGMTLLQWYAGQAIQALLRPASETGEGPSPVVITSAARAAFGVAEKMVEEHLRRSGQL